MPFLFIYTGFIALALQCSNYFHQVLNLKFIYIKCSWQIMTIVMISTTVCTFFKRKFINLAMFLTIWLIILNCMHVPYIKFFQTFGLFLVSHHVSINSYKKSNHITFSSFEFFFGNKFPRLAPRPKNRFIFMAPVKLSYKEIVSL